MGGELATLRPRRGLHGDEIPFPSAVSKDGQRFIHKNYGAWVNNVVADISRNLQLEALN